MPRCAGAFLIGLAAVVLTADPGFAQVIPAVTGRTFTLPTSLNHKLFIPDSFDLSAGGVDVLVHFHGNPATVNNNAGYADLNAVIVNVTYSGFSSAYSTPFGDPALFGNVLDGALDVLRAQTDFSASTQWDQLAVSSFSAGYGAVREILKQPTYYDRIDGLLLADSLYAGFTSASDHTPLAYQMVDFKRFALDAANAQKTMIVSHSQVQTYTYANTAETADDLMQHVGVTPFSVNEPGLGTLQFYRKAQIGDFGVWGATGSDAAAHSRHLQYMAQWLGDLPLTNVVVEPPVGGVIVPLVDFELDEGTFAADPTFSGSNIGIFAATADRDFSQSHGGIASQRIDVTGDAGGWMLRHTSGFGSPANNTPITADGWIGFWLMTDTPGVSVQIGLDDPASADRGTLQSVIADGQWHLYQWDLDDPAQWEAWVFGDGVITGPTLTMDSIFFHGDNNATIFMDDVAYNNTGSLFPPLTGDLNADGFVGIEDLNLVLGNWNQTVTPGDLLQGDAFDDPLNPGFIGIEDLNVVLGNWNAGTPPGTPAMGDGAVVVPEPACGAVLGLTCTLLIRRPRS